MAAQARKRHRTDLFDIIPGNGRAVWRIAELSLICPVPQGRRLHRAVCMVRRMAEYAYLRGIDDSSRTARGCRGCASILLCRWQMSRRGNRLL